MSVIFENFPEALALDNEQRQFFIQAIEEINELITILNILPDWKKNSPKYLETPDMDDSEVIEIVIHLEQVLILFSSRVTSHVLAHKLIPYINQAADERILEILLVKTAHFRYLSREASISEADFSLLLQTIFTPR